MFNIYPYLNVNDLNLDWIIAHFKEFIDEIASLDEWRTKHEVEYQKLLEFKNAIEAGDFTQSMYDAMVEWIEAHLFDFVGEMIKFITIGINDAGYFVINIPSQWNVLVFNTTDYDIETPLQPNYGHLTISY